MKNYMFGFLIAYTLSVTFFAYQMYNGDIASIRQACVENTTPQAHADYVAELTTKRGK